MNNGFTIVVPVRGTNRELKFMEKSIPALVKLNPDELIFGTDDGLDVSIKNKIETICKDHNFTNYRIIEVPRNKEWSMQLANVVWTCYNEAKYDKILSCDIDGVIQKDVLIGRDIVGKNNVAVCSFTKKLLVRNLGEWRRNFFYRIRVKVTKTVFTGVYWVYRPYYFNNINKADYMKLHNGVDTHMYETITKNKTHNIVTRKEIGINSLDLENGDYAWRQFSDGVWWYANLYDYYNSRLYVKGVRTNKSPIGHIINAIERMVFAPYVIYHRLRGDAAYGVLSVYSWKYSHPIALDGYKWAKENKNHDILKKAKGLTIQEWGYLGGSLIKTLDKNFERMDGTGF